MEVGEKARSMRIASDYGSRLNVRSSNLKDSALKHLTQTYPSHSFVIDMQEAENLFKNIRALSENEQKLVNGLDTLARHELESSDSEPIFMCLSASEDEENKDDKPTNGEASAEGDGEDSSATTEAPDDPAEDGVGEQAENLGSA